MYIHARELSLNTRSRRLKVQGDRDTFSRWNVKPWCKHGQSCSWTVGAALGFGSSCPGATCPSVTQIPNIQTPLWGMSTAYSLPRGRAIRGRLVFLLVPLHGRQTPAPGDAAERDPPGSAPEGAGGRQAGDGVAPRGADRRRTAWQRGAALLGPGAWRRSLARLRGVGGGRRGRRGRQPRGRRSAACRGGGGGGWIL